MDRRAKASRPARPTAGDEVLRRVDTWGSVSFAGSGYRVGNRYAGQVVGVRVVSDTVQITQDGLLLRTHRARHDKLKEFGALANPGGRPRRSAEDVAWVPEPFRDTGTETLHFGLEVAGIRCYLGEVPGQGGRVRGCRSRASSAPTTRPARPTSVAIRFTCGLLPQMA